VASGALSCRHAQKQCDIATAMIAMHSDHRDSAGRPVRRAAMNIVAATRIDYRKFRYRRRI
jgi:hypothetical protein